MCYCSLGNRCGDPRWKPPGRQSGAFAACGAKTRPSKKRLIAAESLADDPAQRAQIAASLMGVPVEEVQALAQKQAAKTRGRASLVAGRTRAVVVEYKRPRTVRPTISFSRKR